MRMGKNEKKEKLSIGNILYWAVGGLLVLTILTISLVSGVFAKYVISYDFYDSAHVASSGIGKLDIWEHYAEETGTDSGVYQLNTKVAMVKENQYNKVLPGVDIPKDPYVYLQINNTAVSYELYVQVTETNLPETVTYELTDDWELERSDATKGLKVYKYNGTIDSSFNKESIQILEENMLYVSEHYVGNGKFSLTFSAYLMQAKTN